MHQDTVRLFQGQMQQHTKYTGNFFYAKENSKPVLASYFFKDPWNRLSNANKIGSWTLILIFSFLVKGNKKSIIKKYSK